MNSKLSEYPLAYLMKDREIKDKATTIDIQSDECISFVNDVSQLLALTKQLRN